METLVANPKLDIRQHNFDFRGTASEYFRIWIVNLLLSIITIGIYTAWAKVRRLRYFYGNTFLDGHNFEYHGRPIQILIGRIIIIGIIVVINVLTQVNPLFGLLILPYLIALPWLINKAIGFNARMTSYRNVRFSFKGSYWGAFGVFVAMPIAAAMTAGLLGPVSSQLSSNYIGNRLKFGTAKFRTDAPLGALYGNWGVTIVFTLIVTAIAGSAGFGIGTVLSGFNTLAYTGTNGDIAEFLTAAPGISGIIGAYAALFLAFIFYSAGVRNLALNATTLEGGHALQSSISRLQYVWIAFSNFVLTLLTLSLMRPWAAIRSWRYLMANSAILAASSLDNFVDEAMPDGNVAAAEYLDIEGIDFGL